MQRRQLLHTLGLGLGASLLPHAAQAQPAQLPCFILCVPGGRGWLTKLNTQVRALTWKTRWAAATAIRWPASTELRRLCSTANAWLASACPTNGKRPIRPMRIRGAMCGLVSDTGSS